MRVVACRLELPPTDWHPIMQRLDGLQVWSLPSMEVLHWGPDGLEFTKWVDGTHLVGETLEGQSYHAFYWPQPDVQQDPAGNVAQEIVELVFQLERIGRSSSDR